MSTTPCFPLRRISFCRWAKDLGPSGPPTPEVHGTSTNHTSRPITQATQLKPCLSPIPGLMHLAPIVQAGHGTELCKQDPTKTPTCEVHGSVTYHACGTRTQERPPGHSGNPTSWAQGPSTHLSLIIKAHTSISISRCCRLAHSNLSQVPTPSLAMPSQPQVSSLI